MTRKISFFLIIALLSSGASSLALAEVAAPATQTVQGVISSLDIDAASPWIKVNSSSGDIKIMLDHTSRGYKNKMRISLADLKAGNRVMVDTIQKDGVALAQTVDLE